MPQIKNLITAVLFTACLILIAGCGNKNSKSPIDPDTGKHPDHWIIDHGVQFLSSQQKCKDCHGNNIRGGISNVSCFSNTYNGLSCHAEGPNSHPSGWSDPGQHGALAKRAPSITSGFSYCQKCHGNSFSGGIVNVSCYTCHGVVAPHSPAPWKVGTMTHTTTYGTNAQVCSICHTNGANSTLKPSPFAAGSSPGCFNNTLCHDQRGHDSGFSDPSVHGLQAKADLTVCQQCHATPSDSGPGSNPRFNLIKNLLNNGCEECHDPYTAHPVAWVDHNTSSNRSIACALCHGASLTGGIGPSCTVTCHMESADSVHMTSWSGNSIYRNHGSYVNTNGTSKCSNLYCHGGSLSGVTGSGPSCGTCHAWPGYTYSPSTLICSACHDNPPSGTQYPDVAGKHAVHTSLANVNCSSCHTGAGDNTANHYNDSVEVAFAAAFNSKSGSASFNTGVKTCSNLSCHGGPRTQTSGQANTVPPVSMPSQTPDWLSGVIDVNTDCTLCHVYGTNTPAPEYNSYYSGQHRKHVFDEGILCTECHDTSLLSLSHFTNLHTPVVSGAAATIIPAATYISGTCTIVCHGENHNPENW